MSSVRNALLSIFARVAFGAALCTWIPIALFGAQIVERGERANLDAASVAVSATYAASAGRLTAAGFSALAERFRPWNVAGAAFDRSGAYVAGDPDVHSDGLRGPGDTAPPSGRLVVVVDTSEGYVLLVPGRSYVAYLRGIIALGLAIAVFVAACVVAIAYVSWIGPRERAARRIAGSFATDDTGLEGLGAALSDPLFAAVTQAAGVALKRAGKAAGERAKGEERLRAFLADAGHELRTPLAIAVGYVGILQRDALDDASLARRIVGDIAIEHERLQRLVERILQLARLDAVAGDPHATCDGVRIARECIALVRPLDVTREIELRAPEKLWIAMSPEDLRDAIRNLLENAMRYAPGATIRLTLEPSGDGAIVRVADEGPGMSAFEQEHAFDRFFRGAQSESVIGSGLGLAIVRRIAERAGGTAQLNATRERGTAVELRLPSADVR